MKTKNLLFYSIAFIITMVIILFMSYQDGKHAEKELLKINLSNLDNYHRGVYYSKELKFDSALKYYQLACKDSNKFAFYNLGMMYYHGEGVEKDLFKSFEYIKEGAYLNDSVSQYWLGMCYLHGFGTDTNLVEYDYWINESSKNGYRYNE
ncbi:MAG: tetratricopeptide repeat protein [Bacteroidales bacterium]|nr:tetratricopeptide repeat protein [Bacteroidales bacterium]